MDTNKKKLPLGLRLLRVLTIIGGVFILFAIVGSISEVILSKLTADRFGGSFEIPYINISYLLFNLIYAIFVIIAIGRPSQFLFRISVGLMAVDIVALTVFSFIGYQSVIENILGIVINLWTLWYFFKLKSYFVTKSIDKDDTVIKKIDKKFATVFITLIIFAILIPALIGLLKEYKESSSVTQFLTAFKGKTAQEAIEYCSSLSSDQKDNCLLFLVSFSRGGEEVRKIIRDIDTIDISVCKLFDKEGMRMSCYAVMNRCDLVIDDKMHKLCEPASKAIQAKINAADHK